MLIATQGKSVTGTRQYFDQVLTRGDYYLGQEVAGQWHGKGADILGLGVGSQVTKEQFNRMLEGKHPVSAQKLTQRDRKDRRPGMDLTFSVPKSVSLAWAINEDEKIVEALQQSVRETMERDVEPLMQRRVRKGRHSQSRQKSPTGKLIYADFLHKTSRPVDGNADPHLHVHAFVINWTQDKGKHFAGEFEEIVRQRPSLQAKFESRLARKLKHELGYDVEATRFAQSGRVKQGWEISGLDRKTIEKFSRRTSQVEEVAKEKGIKDAAAKSQLGRLTRDKKDTGKSVDRLRSEWQSRLSDEERVAFKKLKQSDRHRGDKEGGVEESVKYALAHHLYRQSTVERHQVVGTALEHGLVHRPEDVETALNKLNVIQRSLKTEGTDRHMITTQEVLAAERKMLTYSRQGQGTRKAMGKEEHVFEREWLNDQQKAAVTHVLKSRDAVMAVTGGAGTGKSSLMQEAAEALGNQGHEVFVFAPSTGAREVLEDKGFEKAQTVEHLIRNTKMHAQIRDQVIWIDEAGLLDVRSMNAIFDIAKEQNARVVLSGDTRQHSSPRRGEAMRLLEQEGGLKAARVEAIQRQVGRYRRAVEMISRGQEKSNGSGKTGLLAGFDMLDSMGKIKEIDADERCQILAEQYVKLQKNGKTSLIVAPTHAEANQVTAEIRERLKSNGGIETAERAFTQLKSLNLSEAEKTNATTYEQQDGMVVQFHQNVQGGIKRGDRFDIIGTENKEVKIVRQRDGKEMLLPRKMAERFEIYAKHEIKIAAGDKVRFSLGGTSRDGKGRISNGRLDEVKGFDDSGNIVLKNGWKIDRDYSHLDLGYVVTSHASQGKDRQVAIAAMGAQSLPAINAKQFYVTVSRGSEDVTIYVDDKQKVRRAIERSGEQLSASELIQSKYRHESRHSQIWENATEYARGARRTASQWRDRVMRWWNAGREERSQRLESAASSVPEIDLGNAFGMTRNPATPERSI